MFRCSVSLPRFALFFFFNDTATTEIYTLSLHDALPIYSTFCTLIELILPQSFSMTRILPAVRGVRYDKAVRLIVPRSEEHTSELQSQSNLVCRLLLEKKKKLDHNQLHGKILAQAVPRRA